MTRRSPADLPRTRPTLGQRSGPGRRFSSAAILAAAAVMLTACQLPLDVAATGAATMAERQAAAAEQAAQPEVPCEIGAADRPACAVQTFLACLERRDQALCDAVGRGDLDVASNPEPGRIRYEVERVEETGPGTALVYVDQRMCPAGEPGCSDVLAFRIVYETRAAGAGWIVEDWTDAENTGRVPDARRAAAGDD